MTDMRWGVCHWHGGVRVVTEYDDEDHAREWLELHGPGAFLVAAPDRPPLWAPVEGQPPVCAIHGTSCPDPAGCLTVHQAECAAHGLPLLDTGGQT